ncbi:MAG: hypothetical protein M1819_004484 [Sarea resinae]|nr:MAG: hypothetical protein M1819_004484 [Sarea resinae]
MSRRYPVSEIYEERERDYYPERRGREYDEVDVVRRRTPSRRPEPEFLREDYGRTSAGPLVLRERKTEEFSGRREKPKERDYEKEEVIIRPRERERERPREVEKEEFIFRPRERERPREVEKEEIRFRSGERERPREVEREEITFRPRERERPREVEKEEITFRRGERERPPPPREVEKEELVTFRRGERERPPPIEKEEIVSFRRPQRSPPKDYEKEEIIIRRTEEMKEEKKEEPKEPEIIREPTIHQEIVTHHRHIEHEPERAPAPRPPRMPSPSPSPPPPRSYDEIEIRRRGTRNGQYYDDDIIIERENNRKRSEEEAPPRRRSMSGPRLPERIPDYEDEADYYNNKVQERAFIGEAYNGATKDWAIVDVPPGTNRVQMDGIGGGSQEVTWQRYNGVRRAKFIPDGAEPVRGDEIVAKETIIEREPPPLPIGPPPPPRASGLWTEITKDLVVKEAIEQVGFDYEETEYFFYIMDYLRYEDVLELVEISEDIRRERRERIREIQWERERVNERRDFRPYEVEREVVYEGRRPGRYR